MSLTSSCLSKEERDKRERESDRLTSSISSIAFTLTLSRHGVNEERIIFGKNMLLPVTRLH